MHMLGNPGRVPRAACHMHAHWSPPWYHMHDCQSSILPKNTLHCTHLDTCAINILQYQYLAIYIYPAVANLADCQTPCTIGPMATRIRTSHKRLSNTTFLQGASVCMFTKVSSMACFGAWAMCLSVFVCQYYICISPVIPGTYMYIPRTVKSVLHPYKGSQQAQAVC